jgi:hypothetical protein
MEIIKNEFSTDIKLAEGETLEGYGDLPECTISMDIGLSEEEIVNIANGKKVKTILKRPELLGESSLVITVAKEEN